MKPSQPEVIDELSDTQMLSLGDIACLGHPLVAAINAMLDLDEFPVDADGMVWLLPNTESNLH